MMRLNRFALVAGLLALGVAACGDDVEIVQPTPEPPPPPPPVEASMAPASASVAVGSNVVFAVTASGGVAGEAASWTCASSNTGIATVSVTSAGCQATGVAAGSVTITAAVSKSGETVNVGAELTVTDDTEPPQPPGDPAFVLIRDVTSEISDGNKVRGTVSVLVSVDRGDQTLSQVGIAVDGEIVSYQSFGGMIMAPAADEPAEQAPAEFTLSFESDAYELHDDHADVDFMNGPHVLTAGVLVEGSMEPILSNSVPLEFVNTDGVHVMADYPGNKATNPSTGEVWYGGPGGSTFAITIFPVVFSGGAVESVGIREFCGTDLTTATEAPYVFEIDCEGESGSEQPVFVVTVDGRTLDQSESQALNDDLFPINLDFEGPTAPVFSVNPNGREGGWLNADVNLTGENGPRAKANGWLIYYDNDNDGVGGYIPQLRYSTSDPRSVAAARAATPSASPELPAETRRATDICFIVTATDLLGNESALPSATRSCVEAGAEGEIDDATGTIAEAGSGYGRYVTALRSALDILGRAGDRATDAQRDAVTAARTDLRNRGLRAGVDTTPPTAEFTRTSLGTNRRTGAVAREIASNDEFKVNVEDARSGINEGEALVAELEVRDADGTSCVRGTGPDAETTGSVSRCDRPFTGFEYISGDDLAATNILPLGDEDVGYYTFTAQAQDKAGNLSEAISDVALSDTDYPARANVRVTEGSSSNPLGYTLDINLNDDLSVRDYYVTLSVSAAAGSGVALGDDFRLGDVEDVDEFNASDLTTDLDVDERVTLPFLGLVGPGPGNPDEIDEIRVYTRDQREGDQSSGMLYSMDDSDARVGMLDNYVAAVNTPGSRAAAMGDGFPTATTIIVSAYTSYDGSISVSGSVTDDDDEIFLVAAVDVSGVTNDESTAVDEDEDNPFKRVLFYAKTDRGTTQDHWRLIGSVSKNDSEETDDLDRDGTPGDPGHFFTLETDAGEIAAIMDDSGGEDYSVPANGIIAIGIKADVDAEAATSDDPMTPINEEGGAVEARTGVVGMVSDGITTGFAIDL